PSPPPPAAGAAGALVGLAIDVSGSMAGSMPRSLGPSSSRLEAVRGSLERIAREALDAQRTAPADDSGAMLFAFAFGLRIGSVCDLLSLVKVAKDVVTPADIEAARDEVEAEARQKYGDLADRLSGFLGRGAVQQAARRMGEAAVRARVMGVAQERIRQRLAVAGDTTVRAGALAEMWGESAATLQNAEEFIFGDTPMREALQAVADRFERERATLPDAPRVLFILSDGEPTDGDPRPLARRLADAGVTIVSCFVTDRDVTAPRTLFQAAQPGWSEGARLMFDLATPAGPENPFVHPLLRQGWTVPQGARLFVQVNHSEVLEEFVRGLLGYLDATGQALPPRGT
ncbi:MAG TPA: VWA domain-containing protein, partial [Longimicrobium sp.]|nr:VWA domain-containing protein [Longimicrobium sp.]